MCCGAPLCLMEHAPCGAIDRPRSPGFAEDVYMRVARLLCLAGIALALGIAAGCDDPQSSRGAVDPNAFSGSYDGAALVFQLEGSNGEPTTLALFADSLAFDAANDELSALIAVHN